MNSRATLAFGFILGLVVLGFVLWSQLEKRYIFFPTSDIEQTPEQGGLEYEDVFLTTEDGLRLHGWYVPGESDVTWLWFHGNGGNIGHRIDELVMAHRRTGANIFIFDYRGYGESEGKPSEKGTYLDARAVMEYLSSRPDVDQSRIVYLGHSLGAAVAVELSLTQPPMAMVLVSPFASIGDMARVAYPLLPVHLLVRNRYDSLAHIQRIHRPVLILHGDQDKTVPLSQGRKLFEAANQPKQWKVLPGAAHNDTYYAGGAAYWDTLAEFLASLTDRSEGPEPG